MIYSKKQHQRFTPIKRRFGDCFDSESPEHDFKRLTTVGSSCKAGPSSCSVRMKRRFDAVDSSGLEKDGASPRPLKRQKIIGFTTVASSGGSSSSRGLLSSSSLSQPSSTTQYPSSLNTPPSSSHTPTMTSSSSTHSFTSISTLHTPSSPSVSTAYYTTCSFFSSANSVSTDDVVIPGGSRSVTGAGEDLSEPVDPTMEATSFWSSGNPEEAVSLWIESTLLSSSQEEYGDESSVE